VDERKPLGSGRLVFGNIGNTKLGQASGAGGGGGRGFPSSTSHFNLSRSCH